jgi:hypothetical protein
VQELAARDSLASATSKKRTVKRAALLSALVGGLLQIAKSEDTRRISAGLSATLTVGLGGWEATIEDGGPLSSRAESLGRERSALQRALTKFLRKYGETVSREALLGSNYESDYQDLFDMLLTTDHPAAAPSAAQPTGTALRLGAPRSDGLLATCARISARTCDSSSPSSSSRGGRTVAAPRPTSAWTSLMSWTNLGTVSSRSSGRNQS